MPGWQSKVIEHLVHCKRQHLDFEDAWWLAMNAYPPAGGVGTVTTLFDERGERETLLVDFVHRVCRDALRSRWICPARGMVRR
jgi:hypothetical protein